MSKKPKRAKITVTAVIDCSNRDVLNREDARTMMENMQTDILDWFCLDAKLSWRIEVPKAKGFSFEGRKHK